MLALVGRRIWRALFLFLSLVGSMVSSALGRRGGGGGTGFLRGNVAVGSSAAAAAAASFRERCAILGGQDCGSQDPLPFRVASTRTAGCVARPPSVAFCWSGSTFTSTTCKENHKPVLYAGERTRARSSCSRIRQPHRTNSCPPNTVALTAKLSSSSSSSAAAANHGQQPRTVAIVGGGLAGMSTAYHLLDRHRKQRQQENQQQSSPRPSPLHVTIFDTKPVGTGGASAVAGGLLHPLTPRGTLVRDGIRGLGCSRALIQAAESALARSEGAAVAEQNESGTRVVLRDELYRVAASERQARVLQETAAQPTMASMAEWLTSYGGGAHGALRLHSGCQVIHVPSYLKGLWLACTSMCSSSASAVDAQMSVRWEEVASDEKPFASRLNQYDAVILAAGSGLFAPDGPPAAPIISESHSLPVQLVRGQSVEVVLPVSSEDYINDAVLCGKYISPLPRGMGEGRAVLVGATHEYQRVSLTPDEVVKDLCARTEPFLPPLRSSEVWDFGTVQRVTSGVRVQSARGKHGRLPIIGRWEDGCVHSNAWIFTGLSSRGLLYHAMYGEILARAVLQNSEEILREVDAEFTWWKADSK